MEEGESKADVREQWLEIETHCYATEFSCMTFSYSPTSSFINS